jgi:hypothetical protein
LKAFLFGGLALGISKFQFLIKKIFKKFQLSFFLFFVIKTPESGLDPDPASMNPDPQHCSQPITSYHKVMLTWL